MDVIKVSANSRTAAVAGAIAGIMREQHFVEVQSIGAGAVNQAVVAVILAKDTSSMTILISCVCQNLSMSILTEKSVRLSNWLSSQG